MITETNRHGYSAEKFVEVKLLDNKWIPFIDPVNQSKIDIIAEKDGSTVRIQVKSKCLSSNKETKQIGCYGNRREWDFIIIVYSFIFSDERICYVIPTSDAKNRRSFSNMFLKEEYKENWKQLDDFINPVLRYAKVLGVND